MRSGREGLISRARRVAALSTLLSAVSWRGATLSGQQIPAALQGLDAYVEHAMAEWKVPGLALAIVKGDQVVLAKGYGVRELDKPDRVNEGTLFAIGSATKAFTVTALGMLVDENKLRFDDPATKYLPTFQMFDPYANRETTVRDLVTHRTGVSGGDLLWASGEFDRDEIVRRVRFLAPTWSFRSRFDYSNVMFIAAGQVLAAAAAKSWDQVIHERILGPLQMFASTTTIRDLPVGGNIASPHDPTDGVPRVIPWRNMDNTAAAGGINSSARDMSSWLRFQLSHGAFQGRRLVSTGFIAEMQTPQTIIRREGAWGDMSPDASFMAYGMGWIMSDYHGRKLLQHGGGIDGMSAMVGLLPEEELGIVVLSNLNGNQMPAALMLRIFDAYLGRPPVDWSARYLEQSRLSNQAAAAQEQQLEARRFAGTQPTLPLSAYVGTYRSEMVGDAQVSLEGGKLRLRYGTQFDGLLDHVQFDAFQAAWKNPARGKDFVNFTVDAQRHAAELDLYLWVTTNFKRVGAQP